eukprot:750506-Hanusia_phi.AAC.9
MARGDATALHTRTRMRTSCVLAVMRKVGDATGWHDNLARLVPQTHTLLCLFFWRRAVDFSPARAFPHPVPQGLLELKRCYSTREGAT